MTQLIDSCSKEQLSNWLDQVTQDVESEVACLEGSRLRERAYVATSLNRWDEIVQLLLKLSNRQACLDIGTSPFTLVLPRFFNEVHTLDYTDMMEGRCTKVGARLYSGGISASEGKVVIPVPDNMFDCILFLEVIEHLHLNPIDILNVLKTKLKPGGTLILSTPNMMSFGNRLKMVLNRKLGHFHYPPFAENEHPQHGHRHDRVYMPTEIQEYFALTGWSKFQVGYHGMPVSDISRVNGVKGIFSKVLSEPLKAIFPSLRQLILVQAQK
jgi:SAM-dependent methyltransferase